LKKKLRLINDHWNLHNQVEEEKKWKENLNLLFVCSYEINHEMLYAYEGDWTSKNIKHKRDKLSNCVQKILLFEIVDIEWHIIERRRRNALDWPWILSRSDSIYVNKMGKT
jgi:hypothetical protein